MKLNNVQSELKKNRHKTLGYPCWTSFQKVRWNYFNGRINYGLNALNYVLCNKAVNNKSTGRSGQKAARSRREGQERKRKSGERVRGERKREGSGFHVSRSKMAHCRVLYSTRRALLCRSETRLPTENSEQLKPSSSCRD